jgi:hypothetical protein
VTFVDGTTGEIHMSSFQNNPRIDGTTFEPLRDLTTIAQARVPLGAILWPHDADSAPDAMYDAMRDRGVWVLY